MHSHVDSRVLIIKHYDEPGAPLRTWAFLGLPYGTVDLDEIPEKIYQQLEENQIGGYQIEDNRHVDCTGAGVNGQDVILTLVSGVAEGTASTLIEKLAKWCTNKPSQDTKSPRPIDTIEDAKKLISENFNPQGTLQALEISISDTNSKFIFEDAVKNRYLVETVKGIPGSIIAKKLTPQ